MGVVFGVIWAADCNNAIIFRVRRPAHRLRVTRRPPSHQNLKELTDISLWVSILGLFGSLISIIRIYFTSPPRSPAMGHPPPVVTSKFNEVDKYIVMGVEFGLIWAAEFDNAIRFYVCHPTRRSRATRRHKNLILKR